MTKLFTMGDKNINPSYCEQCTEGDNHGMNKVKHNAQNATGDDNAQSNISNWLGNECNETACGGDVYHVHNAFNEPHTSTETESKSSVYHEVNIKDKCSINNRKNSNDYADFHFKGTERTDEDKYDEKDQVIDSDKQQDDSLFSSSQIKRDEMEDNSDFGGSQLDSNKHEVGSVDKIHTNSGAETNISDAHLTLVDQDDGLLKLLGKACGVDKKKLLDEELEPYSKNPFDMEQENTTYGTPIMSESIGVRLAHSGARIVPSVRSKTENMHEEKTVPWQNVTVNAYGESDENIMERKGLFYKKTETRRAMSPIRQPETPNINASQRVSQATPHVPGLSHRLSADDDPYDFSYPERGYMVLIVNDNFVRQSTRDGAIWDLRKMKEIGRKFGFRGLQYQIKERNLTKPELLDVLLKAQRTDHSDCDCFLLVISTHGLEEKNARVGGQFDHALVCADDQLIFTSSIIEMFNDTNCPSLKGKPKIFLIQACRGEQLDHGQTLHVAFPKSVDKTCSGTGQGNPLRRGESFDVSDTNWGGDSWRVQNEPRSSPRPQPQYCVPNVSHAYGRQGFNNVHGTRSRDWASSRTVQKIYAPTPYAIVETPSLKCDNDMLVMYAIPPGMFAWRNTNEGSWMIDYLHQVLMRHDLRKPRNFLNILTQVNALMSRRATNTPSNPVTHNKTAISVIEHKLCKDIVFERKVPLTDWMR